MDVTACWEPGPANRLLASRSLARTERQRIPHDPVVVTDLYSNSSLKANDGWGTRRSDM